jgi:hypothetical protein
MCRRWTDGEAHSLRGVRTQTPGSDSGGMKTRSGSESTSCGDEQRWVATVSQPSMAESISTEAIHRASYAEPVAVADGGQTIVVLDAPLPLGPADSGSEQRRPQGRTN